MPLASSSSGECVFSVRLEAMFLTMFDLPPVGVTPRSPVRSCVFKFSAGSCVDPLGVFVSIYGLPNAKVLLRQKKQAREQ